MAKADEHYWNTAYADLSFSSDHDGWLAKYIERLHPTAGRIVDLGCGLGHNARVLNALGFDVLACDLSEQALKRIRNEHASIATLRLDMAHGLPFADASLQAIIADLSLHYFPGNVTQRIIADIRRSLRPGGLLLLRVNAVGELASKPGAVPTADDPYLYESEGILRRFFDESELRRFFPDREWTALERSEQAVGRYGQAKIVWENGLVKR